MLLFVPRQMTDLKINEVSGVNRAANLAEGWLVMKSAGLDSDVALTLARAEAVAKGLDPNSITKGNDMPALTDEARAELSEDAQEYVKSLEDVIEAAAVAKAEADTAAEAAADEPTTEAEALAKAMGEMPEPLRKAFEDNQRKAAAAEETLRKMADERADAHFSAVAKSFDSLPDSTTSTLAKALREVAEKAPDAYEPLAKTLKAANAAIEKSPLFKEFGSGGNADADSDDPAVALVAKANEIMAEEKGMTFPAAMTKAATLNPDLYAQHRAASKQ